MAGVFYLMIMVIVVLPMICGDDVMIMKVCFEQCSANPSCCEIMFFLWGMLASAVSEKVGVVDTRDK